MPVLGHYRKSVISLKGKFIRHSYVWLRELNIKCFFSGVPYNNNNNNFYSESEVELSVGEVLKGVMKPDSQSFS